MIPRGDVLKFWPSPLSFRHTRRMKIEVKRIGGIWHGTVEGTDIDERGLTAEIAERKAREMFARRIESGSAPLLKGGPLPRTRAERRRSKR